MALGDIDVHSAWQAWHLWHWAGSGGALGSRLALLSPRLFVWQAWHLATSAFTLCGRRGTWRHRRAFCMAGVALMALGWLWWRAWVPFGTVVVPLTLILACLSHLPGGPETLCKLDCCGDILEV